VIFRRSVALGNMNARENNIPPNTSQQKPKTDHQGKPNHLIQEKSPYLQQHAFNPVEWYPWGEKAFQVAIKENKPIFLSIGYSTCHWCHVMEHESFEDEEVAKVLNAYFVSIKVDREERPDIDHVYMTVCQAMTGSGGWPLNLFLTPQRKPFYAGTYFPKTARYGNPGFIAILKQIANLWNTGKESIIASSEQATKVLQSMNASSGEVLTVETLKQAYEQLRDNYDSLYGGFGSAPKFPTPHNYTFLLRWWKRSNNPMPLDMVEKTLDRMGRGGMYDQLGGGFHRYSTDEYWLVPHFEKMLYDQALLAISYLETYQATGKVFYADTVRGVLNYVLRDMTSPEGGFFSAEDADSEGVEGRFYVWTSDEIIKVLGEKDGRIICDYYDVSKEGNFEDNNNILHVDKPIDAFVKLEGIGVDEFQKMLGSAREKLFQAREKRIYPHKDDKILTSWNGLMISAFARGAQALDEPKHTRAAVRAADFILSNLRETDGSLLRCYRLGEAFIPAYLDDYAYFVGSLIDLYETTFEVKYLKASLELNKHIIDNFWDEMDGGLFFGGKKNEPLIAQTKEVYDGALPSGNSMALLNILRLGHITGNLDLMKIADRLTSAFSDTINQYPSGYTQFLCAIDFAIGPTKDIVIAGEPGRNDTKQILREIGNRFIPRKTLLISSSVDKSIEDIAERVKAQNMIDNKATVYVCEKNTCKSPATDMHEIVRLLE